MFISRASAQHPQKANSQAFAASGVRARATAAPHIAGNNSNRRPRNPNQAPGGHAPSRQHDRTTVRRGMNGNSDPPGLAPHRPVGACSSWLPWLLRVMRSRKQPGLSLGPLSTTSPLEVAVARRSKGAVGGYLMPGRTRCPRHERAVREHDGLHKYPGHARYRAVEAHDGRNAGDVMNRPNKCAPTRRSAWRGRVSYLGSRGAERMFCVRRCAALEC